MVENRERRRGDVRAELWCGPVSAPVALGLVVLAASVDLSGRLASAKETVFVAQGVVVVGILVAVVLASAATLFRLPEPARFRVELGARTSARLSLFAAVGVALCLWWFTRADV